MVRPELGRGGNHHLVLDVGDYLGGCPSSLSDLNANLLISLKLRILSLARICRNINHLKIFAYRVRQAARAETFSPRLSLRRGGHSNTPTRSPPLETGGHLLS
jgi:hypothetical protein